MARTARASAIAIAALLLLGRAALAADPEAAPVPEAAPPAAEGAGAAGAVVPSADIPDEVKPTRRIDFGLRGTVRGIFFPSFLLNLFTEKNVPLSTLGYGIGAYGRRGNFTIMGSFNYMNMSPPDGNWLGKGHDPAIDTDYVQFKSLALWAFDVSFIWNTMFTNWFGMHYGAGIGVGIVSGHILRTSDSSACTLANAGDLTQCHPVNVTCNNGVCSEADLNTVTALNPSDSAATPHRFTEPSVPPALPIVNVVVGVDFRIPQVKGWEATIEGGFYDAFYLGGSVGYTF